MRERLCNRSLRIRTDPTIMVRGSGAFFFGFIEIPIAHTDTRTPPLHLHYNLTRSTLYVRVSWLWSHARVCRFPRRGVRSRMWYGSPPWRSPLGRPLFRACRSSIASASAICRS